MAGPVGTAFNTAFRDYVVDGVSGSGPNKPSKSEIRAAGILVDTAIGPPAFLGDGTLTMPLTSGDGAQTLTLVCDSATSTRDGLGLVKFGGATGVTCFNTIHWYTARGTKASPTVPLADDVLSSMGTRAWEGSIWGLSSGAIIFTASENQGVGTRGTYATIETTPDGSNCSARVPGIVVTNRGDVVNGTPTASALNASIAFSASGFFKGVYGPNNTGAFFAKTNGANAIFLDRETSDGALVEFRRGAATVVGTISVTASATAYNTSSDERLKTRAAPIDVCAFINAVSPHAVTWNATGEPDFTFFAQELGRAQDDLPGFPMGVTKGSPKGVPISAKGFVPWSVDNSKYVPLLWSAVQLLLGRVAKLEGAA